jgi:hypothetical protein
MSFLFECDVEPGQADHGNCICVPCYQIGLAIYLQDAEKMKLLSRDRLEPSSRRISSSALGARCFDAGGNGTTHAGKLQLCCKGRAFPDKVL